MAFADALHLYNAARKLFCLIGFVAFPASFMFNVPFGRFAPKSTFLTFDGRKAFMLLAIVAPIMCTLTFLRAPLSGRNSEPPTTPQIILFCLFLVHYTNRAIITTLRTPYRSRSHLFVPVSGGFMSCINGFLIGSYLTSEETHLFLEPSKTFNRPTFFLGLTLWAVGFVGNVIHDDMLSNIRRKAGQGKQGDVDKVYYGIPYGGLYRWISFPNYFCEWVEWFGWALAASPLPPSTIFSLMRWQKWLRGPAMDFAPGFTPPFMMFCVEIMIMFPRAYTSHQWYLKTFGDTYPKDRKIIIPYIL